MEILKNFFSGLKERLSSPFFISFLVSWCTLNYRIVITLLFYKHNEVKWDGCRSYVELIQWLYDQNQIYFWYPLLLAALFSIAYPLFKSTFELFQEVVITWKDHLFFKFTNKLEAVSIETHKALSDELEKDKADYARVINTARSEREFLTSEKEVLSKRIFDMEQINKSLEERFEAEHNARMQVEQLLVDETDKLVKAREEKAKSDAVIEEKELENSKIVLESDLANLELRLLSEKHAQTLSDLEMEKEMSNLRVNLFGELLTWRFETIALSKEIPATDSKVLQHKFKMGEVDIEIFADWLAIFYNHIINEYPDGLKVEKEI